jgi:hypothetical protein
MEGSDPVFIHPYPWTNQKHGGPSRSYDIRYYSPERQEYRVHHWGCLPAHLDVNTASYHIQGANESDKTDVFLGCMCHRGCFPIHQKVSRADYSESNGDMGVALVPEVGKRNWPERNAGK